MAFCDITLTSGSICTDHTWQQFDSFPKYGGKIHVRQSDPDRGRDLIASCELFGRGGAINLLEEKDY